MSQENVELTRVMADAFNRRDWDAFRALSDDEIEVESRLVAMEGAYRGHPVVCWPAPVLRTRRASRPSAHAWMAATIRSPVQASGPPAIAAQRTGVLVRRSFDRPSAGQ